MPSNYYGDTLIGAHADQVLLLLVLCCWCCWWCCCWCCCWCCVVVGVVGVGVVNVVCVGVNDVCFVGVVGVVCCGFCVLLVMCVFVVCVVLRRCRIAMLYNTIKCFPSYLVA